MVSAQILNSFYVKGWEFVRKLCANYVMADRADFLVYEAFNGVLYMHYGQNLYLKQGMVNSILTFVSSNQGMVSYILTYPAFF